MRVIPHLFICFVGGLLLVAGGQVMANIASIPIKPEGLITQDKAGKSACGPTALFYALKFGNHEMRSVYSRLKGLNDEEKLRALLETHGSRPSKTRFRPFRYDPDQGTSPLDLMATANELVKSSTLQSQILHRRDDESQQGSLLRRIHATLRRSLINRVPVVSIIVPYVGTYLDGEDVNEWSEHNGHYVVITEVPENLEEGQLGFTIKYLDPETGRPNQAYLYEEVVREFWGRKDKPDGSAEWIHPEVKAGGKVIASPYLTLTAPGLKLNPRTVKHSQRVVLTLTTVIGNFSSSETL